jgi:uncharacterized protein YbjT (DUF2867 family)
MRVLLTGANGFIGRYLLAALVAAGHDVVPAVRDPEAADRLLPGPRAIRVDLNRDIRVEDWLQRLAGIDAVVNCAGILQGRPGQSIAAIHGDAPKALFEACERANVRRVIQISAISAKEGAHTRYAETKRDADLFLATRELDWVLVRPSLVYAAGAYGGTAVFRALAALPFVTPLVGNGEQAFQPVHIDDVTATVLHVLATPPLRRVTIDPVGPDRLTLAEILRDLRRWLGFAPSVLLPIPVPLVRIATRFGDVLGGPVNSTALRQLEFGNDAPPDLFTAATGIVPRRWKDVLIAEPAQTQDRFHARLYFLPPLVRLAVALTWIGSGIAGLVHPIALEDRVAFFGIAVSRPVFWCACALDMLLGVAVMARWRPALLAGVQLALVAFYTAVLSVVQPSLWIEPLGPLLKNIVFVAAVLVLAAMEFER